jgi:hypothetical protein
MIHSGGCWLLLVIRGARLDVAEDTFDPPSPRLIKKGAWAKPRGAAESDH